MPTGEMIVGAEGSKFVALRPDSVVREALMANLGPGESFKSFNVLKCISVK